MDRIGRRTGGLRDRTTIDRITIDRTTIDRIGYTAAGFFAIFQLPQIYKAIRTKSADDISVPMVLGVILASILTIYYAYYAALGPILVENICVLTESCILLFLVYMYRDKSR
jgi:uncharacterized protein with PQ loop repeat